MSYSYASAPKTVDGDECSTQEYACAVEETLCPVVSHVRVNSEYKHLVVRVSAKALDARPGQFFQILCPSPDQVEVWFRRPQSVYRIDVP